MDVIGRGDQLHVRMSLKEIESVQLSRLETIVVHRNGEI